MNKSTVPYLTSRIYIPLRPPLFPVLATTIRHLATSGSIQWLIFVLQNK